MNTELIEQLNRIKETQIALREHISHAIKGVEQLEEIKRQKELSGDTDSVAKINETLNQVKPLLAQILDSKDNTVGKIEGSESEDYARTMYDSARIEKGKALSEALSTQARLNTESIQQRRNERYEEMITQAEQELGPIESPMSRLGR
ncbi:MAG TPA: hypothetical protein OIM65_02935 [Bacilli bacterium]|nr:hypothetical protein [Bacilli bacterium]